MHGLGVDIRLEIENATAGLDGGEEQSMATVMAAGLAAGSLPPTLDFLQQVVKAELVRSLPFRSLAFALSSLPSPSFTPPFFLCFLE